MDSRISKQKLTGVVKSYRRRTQTQTQFLKPRTLAAMNLNLNMNLNIESTRNKILDSKPAPKPLVAPKLQEAKKASRPKLSKWDFKGRLAYAEEELAAFKNKLKNAKTRSGELDAELEELVAREETSRTRAEKAEASYSQLIIQREALSVSTKNKLVVSVALRKEVDGMEAELKETRRGIEICEENYKNHDSKMIAVSEEIMRVRAENGEHEETIGKMLRHKEELDIVLEGIQEKRNEMLETLRILRGDD